MGTPEEQKTDNVFMCLFISYFKPELYFRNSNSEKNIVYEPEKWFQVC